MSNTNQQPFVGSLVAGALAKVATTVITKQAEKVLSHKDVPLANSKAPEVADKIAAEAAPAVVAAMKKDPKLSVALNAEPLSQSVNLWLGIATCVSALGGIGTLYFNGSVDGMDAYGALIATFMTGMGMVVRRTSLQS